MTALRLLVRGALGVATTASALTALLGCGAASGLDAASFVSSEGGGGDGNVAVGAGGVGGAGGDACVPRTSDTWSIILGEVGDATNIHTTAIDASGNVILLAATPGPVDFGCGVVAEAKGEMPQLLAKLDPHGNLLWQRAWKSDITAYGARPHVGIDDAGRIYVEQPVRPFVGDSPYPRSYVASFDAEGDRRWEVVLPEGPIAMGFAVASDGSSVVGGDYWGAPDFGVGPLPDAGSNLWSFVLHLDNAGHVTSDFVVEDAAGNDVLGGVGAVALLPGGDLLMVTGGGQFGSPAALDRRTSSGEIVWTRTAGVDPNPDFVFGPQLFVGADAAFAVSVDTLEAASVDDGAAVWSNQATAVSATCTEPPCGVFYGDFAIRPDGTGLAVGWLQGTANLGRGDFAATDAESALLVAIGSDGSLSPSTFGGADEQRFESVALDATGHAVVTGTVFDGSLDLGAAGVVTSEGKHGARSFVARIALP